MRHTEPQLRDALTWCTDNTLASVELRDAAARRLRVLDTANRLHENVVHANSDELLALKHDHQQALVQLVDDPTSDNLRAVSDLVLHLDVTKQRQLRDVRAAEYAVNQAGAVAGQITRDYHDEILQLVAAARCVDVTACGDDAVQPTVRWVWNRLQFRWHPRFDDTLTLPQQFHAQPFTASRHHLPITWHELDSADYRASVAWVWQQIAAGNFERVPMPLTLDQRKQGMQPGALGNCVRITSDVDVLPRVPAAKQQPQVLRR
jgi:hypothetical protein